MPARDGSVGDALDAMTVQCQGMVVLFTSGLYAGGAAADAALPSAFPVSQPPPPLPLPLLPPQRSCRGRRWTDLTPDTPWAPRERRRQQHRYRQ